MRLRGRLVGNTLVQFVNPALRVGLGIVLTAALSRYLGVAGYGEYALVFAYVATFNGIFNNWGLSTICLREISQHPEARAQVLTSTAALQALVAGGSYGLLLAGLPLLNYPPTVNWSIALYGLSVLLTPLDILALPFQADLRLAQLVAPAMFGALLNFLFSMAVISLNGPLFALVGAALAALALQYLWVTVLSIRSVPATARPAVAHWKPLVRDAWPLGLATIVTTGLQQAPVLLLSLFSLEAVGLFNAASRIPQQLLMIPLALQASVFPVLSRTWTTDRARFRTLLNQLVEGTLLLVVPVVVLAIGLAEPIMRLLFSAQFAGAVKPFALMIVVFGLLCPGILVGEALIAAGLQRVNLVILSASTPVLAVLLLVLVPARGAAGAALALALCYSGILAALMSAAHRRLGTDRIVQAVARAVLAAVLGVSTLALAPLPEKVLSATIGATVALTTIALLSPAAPRELLMLLRALPRPRRAR